MIMVHGEESIENKEFLGSVIIFSYTRFFYKKRFFQLSLSAA